MKFILSISFLLNFVFAQSYDSLSSVIDCSKHHLEEMLRPAVGKQIFSNNFRFEKSKTIIEVYNNHENKLERFTLDELRESAHQVTEIGMNYKVLDDDEVLTELLFPFNLNCTTPWDLEDVKEIIDPYLKFLQDKVKISLKEALSIGQENGLSEIYEWDIDLENTQLVWTLKSRLERDKSKVIKLNAKNGKILSEYIIIPID